MAPAEVVEVKHKDETLAFKCWEKDGLKLPLRVKDPDAKFKEIKELEYKDGDIIIASYPKVGTNWLKDSLGMLMKGKAEVAGMVGSMLELHPTLEEYKKKETRRVAITHLRPAQLSDSQTAKAKFILGIRNPKDAAVSLFHHIRKELTVQFQGSWDQFFDLYASRQVIYGWFFDYYREWQKFIESHSDQVLVVYYEDMHKNYQKELRRIADFLGLTVADELITQIAKKGQMKTVHDELIKSPEVQAMAKEMTTDGSLLFYRKGEVGDWKNHFTVAQNEMFDKIIENEMNGLMFKFDYVL